MDIFVLFFFSYVGQNIYILCACGKACFPCCQECLGSFLCISILKLATLGLHKAFRYIGHSLCEV